MTRTKTASAAQPALFEQPAGPRPAEGTVKVGDTVTEPGKKPGKIVAVATTKRKAPRQDVAVVEPRGAPNLLAAIVHAANDPKCDPGKMHALIDVRERLMAHEARVAFMTAYIEMQEDLPTINAKGKIEVRKRGADGERTGAVLQSTPYATFNEIHRVVKPILRKHKFGLMMLPDVAPAGGVLMRGQLIYVSDTQYGKMVHAEQCVIAAPLETSGSKNNVQGVGSSLSYTKRYCAIALLNLVSHAEADKDDDGVAAPGPKGAKRQPAPAEEVALIDKKQLAELRAAIKDCGATEDMVCTRFEVEKLDQMTPQQFGEAKMACVAFKARKEQDGKDSRAQA